MQCAMMSVPEAQRGYSFGWLGRKPLVEPTSVLCT
jgi:hypothetical protein